MQKCVSKDRKLSQKFSSSTQEDQEWVLNYLPSGKGTIPYEIITRFESLYPYIKFLLLINSILD